MKFSLFLILFVSFNICKAQVTCLDTNCSDFKQAFESHKNKIPKNYTGYVRYRHEDVGSVITLNFSTKKKKYKNGTINDYIKARYSEPLEEKYKVGQTKDIKQLLNGKIQFVSHFHDNGNLSTLFATLNSENKSSFLGNYISFPIISYYKSKTVRAVFYSNNIGNIYSKILYYPNQKIMLKTFHNEEGEIQGIVTSYYENGKVEKIGMANRNLLHGYLLSYTESGELISTQFFRNNLQIENLNSANNKAQLYNLRSIVEEENANIDRQESLIKSITDLQLVEESKRKKEDELRTQKELVKHNQLELELLAKNKAVSDLSLKAKEAELLKNILAANQKQKEIEDLSHRKTMNELIIKKKEHELLKNKIEAEKKFLKNKIEAEKNEKLINGLEKEKTLNKKVIEQQNYIQGIILIGLSFLLILSFFLFKSFRKTKKANKIISQQNEITDRQKQLIESKQLEIVDSINYAKRLQNAVLPPLRDIVSYLPKSFVFYKPKDIVAGDFYWTDKRGDYFYIAAADCTGHGVPGAMVSLVCSNALYRTVNEFGIYDTGKILDNTRNLLLETFRRSGEEIRDGMDISLCRIDRKKKEIQWSGANNPLWYFDNSQLIEIKGDKQSIGKTDDPLPFSSHKISYNENSHFYLFTDGYADQFSEENKKMTKKRFRELICNIQRMELTMQRDEMKNYFLNWMGNSEQIDDVCVIAFSPF